MSKKKAKPKKRAREGAGAGDPAVALLYNLGADTPKGQRVQGVLAQFGIAPREVGYGHLGDPAGALAGLRGMRPAAKSYTGDAPDVEFMLLCNVPAPTMPKLLSAMHEADAYVGAKAMLTSHNKIWPLHILIAQVAQEHVAMTGE